MRERGWLIQLVCGVLAVACLFACGPLSVAITAEAGRAQMVYTDQAQEGDPPEVALGIAMGAFRGLFVNYLWLRATKLKEQGKFYEAIELSQAITRLQPRFPRVWAFHAWNMSYNISVATNTSSERWTWVKAGIDLLRKEAIPRNPNDVLLHKELAWIFNHKIQSFSDDANRYYKRKLAEEWTFVLGTPPALPEDTQLARKQMIEWFKPVRDAPDTLEQLYKNEIADQKAKLHAGDDDSQLKSKTAELVAKLKEGNLKLDEDLLRFVTLNSVYKSSWYAEHNMFKLNDSAKNAVVDKLMADEQYKDAWPRLLAFVRHDVLVHEKRMEPDRMVRYTEKYGPLDWRHPSSHAIYWAARGVEEQLERTGDHNFDTLNTDRLVTHALQELFRSGRIFYDPVMDSYTALLDTNFADAYGDVVAELAKRGGIAESERRAYTLYGAGYENFLRDVIRVYYRRAEYDKAQEYFKKLYSWPGLNRNDPDVEFELKLPLDEFVKKQLRNDRITVPHVAAGECVSSLLDAYYGGLLRGDMKRFVSGFKYAQAVHEAYFEEQNKRTVVDTEANRMDEMSPNFPEVAAQTLISMLAMGDMDPTQASRIFEKSPATIQQIAYDNLRSMMLQRGMPESAVVQLFPEPAGMKEYRQARAALEKGSADEAKKKLQAEQK